METFLRIIGAIILAVILILGFALSTAYFVQYLWNTCLVGAIDGVHQIGFWQAFGLSVLCGFLFKSSASSSKK